MPRPRHVRLALAVLLFLVLSGGCVQQSGIMEGLLRPTQTAIPSKTPTLPPPINPTAQHWWICDQRAEGFAVSLPGDWEHIALSSEKIDEVVARLKKTDAKQAETVKQSWQPMIDAGVRLYCYNVPDNASGDNRFDRLSVARVPLKGPMDLDAATQAALAYFEANRPLEAPLQHRRVTLTGGEAEEIELHFQYTNEYGVTVHAITLDYVLIHGDDFFEITLTTDSTRWEKTRPLFEQIALSFQIVD